MGPGAGGRQRIERRGGSGVAAPGGEARGVNERSLRRRGRATLSEAPELSQPEGD
jgi:hypothetical protein